MKPYKKALYIAAKEAYKSEVVDTEMEIIIIGPDTPCAEYESKEEWIEARVAYWLDEAEDGRNLPIIFR